MDIESLKIFVSVVQERGFTAAAVQLEIPKQTVSRRVADLESTIGTRLLDRSTRKLRLTNDGEIFYEYATRMVSLSQDALSNLQNATKEPKGRLRISAPYLFGELVLRHVVLNHMNRYPKVTISASFSTEQTDLFDDNIDISFQHGPLKDSSWIAKRITPAWFGCYCAPEFFEEHTRPDTPNDLPTLPTIVYQESAQSSEMWSFDHINGQHLDIPLKPVLSTNSFWLAREACINGKGIARLPAHLCAIDVKERRLIPVLENWSFSVGPLYAIYHSRKKTGTPIQTFLDLLDDHLHIPSDAFQPKLPKALNSEVNVRLIEPNVIFNSET